MNKITILGSGDTLGTPLPNCACSACRDSDLKSIRNRFGILIEYNGKKLLVDTNPDLKAQCFKSNFELKDIDYILITHTHSDHLNGMGEFHYRRKEITKVFYHNDHITEKNINYFKYLEHENVLSFRTYENYEKFNLSDFYITPIGLNHGFPCSGFIIEVGGKKISIVSDTCMEIPSKSIECMKGCDYFFVDAFSENYSQIGKLFLQINEKVPESIKDSWYHLDISDAKELKKQIRAKKTFTVHMSHLMNKHSDLVEKHQNNDFIIGYDNLIIDL